MKSLTEGFGSVVLGAVDEGFLCSVKAVGMQSTLMLRGSKRLSVRKSLRGLEFSIKP